MGFRQKEEAWKTAKHKIARNRAGFKQDQINNWKDTRIDEKLWRKTCEAI